MKRRAISFMTALVLCLGLCPAQVLAAGGTAMSIFNVNVDTTVDEPYEIYWAEKFDTHGNSYVSTVSTALIIMEEGSVYLTYGTIKSEDGAGVEVQAGGFLCVEDPGMNVIGTTYGLYIESGANVQISGGTFTGGIAAIGADDYLSLLADGCALFDDEDGDPIKLTDMAGKKKVVVKECTDHKYDDYTANTGKPTHDGTCVYCGKTSTLECTFNLNGNTSVKCADCDHVLTITIDDSKLNYTGNDTNFDAVEVRLDDGAKLTEGTDYTVKYSTRVDGEITVTVTSTSQSHTWTYTESFYDTRAVLTISWADGSDRDADYTGRTVARSVLPEVIISGAVNDTDEAELEQLLYFSYKKEDDANFTDGLPTNAGKYQIKANLSETQNYQAAESEPIDLEITKINPIIDDPEAVTVTYDRYAHELVTPGSVWPGAVIQFALGGEDDNRSWSTEIPKATNAGNYNVYYKVEETDNYEEVLEEPITARIQQRRIEPGVKLDQTSFVYDNGTKEPPVTVTDPSDGNWVLPDTEYKVKYANNQNVGTATATVSPAENSNYDFTPVERQFTITTANQAGLTITGLPNQVFYGDVFTLGTSGGSGNGTVTWEITAAKDAAGGVLGSSDFGDVAEIDEYSGQVKVNGLGSFTVQATKLGGTNLEDTTATVTFHVDPRPVTATVTAANKPYDGTNAATVSAKVEQGIVSGDTITITGVTGKFSDENAGTGKTVTVSIENAVIDAPVVTIGADPDVRTFKKYVVTIPTTPVSADITPKTLAKDDLTVTLDCYSYTYDGSEKKPVVTVKDGSDEIPPKEYTVTYSNNINVGTATGTNPPTVTVTDNAGGNYTVDTVEINFDITTGGQAVLTSSPLARDLTYNGELQDLVTVGTATGGTLKYALKTGSTDPAENDYKSEIPQEDDAGEYTVYYKVVGDANHVDSAVYSVYVTIKPKTVTSPVIELAASKTFTYDGAPKTFVFNKPDETDEITVKDGSDVIPATEYTVTYSNNVNAGTATVHIVDKNGGNYNVSGNTTFEIGKATAAFTKAPTAKTLVYNAKAQPLITVGVAEGGTAYYRLEGGTYSTSVPTGTDCATYKVYAMVQGDANHEDSEPMTTPIEVTIDKNTVKDPHIELSSEQFTYNGSAQKPTVRVFDDAWNEIAASEYIVSYVDGDTVNVKYGADGEVTAAYKVVVTSQEINYHFEKIPEKGVTILPADQDALNIIDRPSKVYFGDTIQLSTTGGSGNGAVTWSVVEEEGKTDKDTDGNYIAETGESEGQFIINGVGDITVRATRTPDNRGYGDAEAEWKFHAFPKPVDAVVTVKSRDYVKGSTATELLSVSVPAVKEKEIGIKFKEAYKDFAVGYFADENVGTNKLVTFTIADYMLEVTDGENYDINYPTTAMATIWPTEVEVTDVNKPTKRSDLVYSGQEQPLLTLPAVALDGGDWAYSTDGASYGPNIPKGENAGTYEVWYKVIPDSNHKFDDDLDPVTVTIEKKPVEVKVTCSPETFPYDGTEKTPNVIVTYNEDGSEKEVPTDEYTVEFPEERIAANDENYTVTVTAKANGNYEFTNNSAEGTFKILPAGQAPLTIVTEKPGFVYYDDTFRLSAVGGSGDGGIIWEIVDEKDKDGGTVSEKAIAEITSDGVVTVNGVGSFTVTAYREGTGGSYKDSDEVSMTFTVRPKQVNAVVEPVEMDYDKDRSLEIDDLSASVPGTDIEISGIKGTLSDVNAGDKIVRIDRDSIKDENITFGDDDPKNYSISYPETITVTIKPAEQYPFSIDGPSDPIYYGDQFTLSTSGGSGNGVITWSGTGVDVDNTGLVKVTGVGTVTITATKAASTDGNYKAAGPVTWSFTAEKKTVTATVTAEDKTYDGGTDATLHFTWTGLINDDTIDTDGVEGTFDNENVGTGKTVTITGDITDTRYDVTIPSTTTATISKAKADVENPPRANTDPIYVKSDTELVTAGTTVGGIGTIVYALENPYEEQEKQDDMLDEDLDDYEDLDPDPPGLVYTEEIPTAEKITKADTYRVWYKIMPATNWIGTEAKYVEVTITRAGEDAGKFEEEDDFEDLDSINPGSTPSQAPSTSQTSTSSPGTDTSSGTNTSQATTKPGTGSVSMQTSVQDKTASTVLDTAAGSQLVNEAVANKSANVVIKPEITGDVSKTEVSIPASAVSRIGSETDAALTVSTPVADVTIPNTSLDTLSSAGGAVSIVTERVENTVVLTLNAGGKDIGDIPGGLTLTVPSENTTPGTVAVLVREDGTREIIRKSVAEDGSVRIPLNGSATVEIVDNGKEFADVPAESWAADAVAFASAHEILNGTGEAMFSPEISMSRAMLATVLYNLEGCPDQGLTSAFSDVDSDAWYAAGISWAAANGITSGYGDGQYGPNDDITREQLAVMLWRYMESPAADKQVPDFTDTDQASSYAMEALYWATANGIVNGYGNGHLDPSGLATRAQAAQMLKNFLENT